MPLRPEGVDGGASHRSFNLAVHPNGDSTCGGAAGAGNNGDVGASRPPQRGVTPRQAVLNLIAGGLGTGMFSLPWSTAGASVLPSIGMTFLVILLNAWTIMILVQAADRHQVFDLGGVLGLLPGRLGSTMQVFCNVMVWVELFTSLISYLVVMHDAALPFVEGTFMQARVALVGLGSLLVLPLCFLEQRYLSWTSTIAFAINIYLIGVLCILFSDRAVQDALPTDVCYLGFSVGSVSMVSSLMQCIIVQMCILPMYEELQDRTPRKFLGVLAVAFGSLVIVFAGFACVGYLVFGPTVEGDVLKSLPKGPWADVAKIGTIPVVAAIYPIMVIPMIAPLKNMGRDWFARPTLAPAQVEQRRKMIVTIITVGIVAVSFVGALLIASLDTVNVIGGSIGVGVFTALSPALVGLYLLDRRSVAWKVSMGLLLCLGIAMGCLGLGYRGNYTDALETACRWPSHIEHDAFDA